MTLLKFGPISPPKIQKNPIQLAREIGIKKSELDLYGDKKAKVSLKVLDRLSHVKDGKYVVVAGKLPVFIENNETTWNY